MQSYRAEIANGHLVEDFIQHALDLSHAYIHIQTYRHAHYESVKANNAYVYE